MNWFVGLGPIILKEILAGGTVAGLLAAWWFIPITFPRLKTLALAAACIVGAGTVAYNVGVHDESKRDQARWADSNNKEIKSGEQARTDGNADVDRAGDSGMQHDRHNRAGSAWHK